MWEAFLTNENVFNLKQQQNSKCKNLSDRQAFWVQPALKQEDVTSSLLFK
jgi:hypothetical protein